MKNLRAVRFFLVVAAIIVFGCFSASSARAERPAVSADQAVTIATDYLKKSGYADDHWISSATLVSDAFTSKKFYWFIKWVPAVQLEGRKELGLQIHMDGSIVRSVDKKAKS